MKNTFFVSTENINVFNKYIVYLINKTINQ